MDLNVMNTVEAAKYTGLATVTLEKMRVSGDGPPYIKIAARAVRYRVRDIDAWLDARVVTSTSQRVAV